MVYYVRESNKEVGMALPAKRPLPGKFPKKESEKFLRDWWREQEQATIRRGNPFADAKAKSGTVFAIQPQLSSLEAVAILTALKNVVGFEPSKSVIKKGGYKDVEDLVSDFMPRLEKQFDKK
jgi:hypothetical protein